MLDGTAFRGRDATFDHLKLKIEEDRETDAWWASIEEATKGVSDSEAPLFARVYSALRNNGFLASGGDNAPTVILEGVDLVDSDDPDVVDVVSEGEIDSGLEGPVVDASGQRSRFKSGAKLFLRLKFGIDGGADRGSFTSKEDVDGSNSFSVSTPNNTKWVTESPTIDAAATSATIYVPLKIQDGTFERITVKATVRWVDRVETGIRGQVGVNVPKSKVYTFRIKVKFSNPTSN